MLFVEAYGLRLFHSGGRIATIFTLVRHQSQLHPVDVVLLSTTTALVAVLFLPGGQGLLL